ncbi:hypothetical protein GCM10007853_06580 [Algimonas ampicilliniresistens]|uniref:Uncharacterized protein n=1 Tax=Algimonas ampicilliniresistens TaxID=1298735 RepID=A0ABQ5V7S9_9PROT|nr:hypothetical protein GCM10007853_06580 [Algimonas ampicilliniresistens]
MAQVVGLAPGVGVRTHWDVSGSPPCQNAVGLPFRITLEWVTGSYRTVEPN